MSESATAAVEAKEDFLSYSEDLGEGRFASRVRVAGIHCAACAGTIESLVKQAGVEAVQVNSSTGRARVVWQAGQTAPTRWMQAVEKGGYTMAPIAGTDWLEISRKERRLALWRWLVAAFCMMQGMTLMWPFYELPGAWGGTDLDPQSAMLLRWGLLMLSIPVMIFSSAGFFQAAWRDLRLKRISMDLPVAIGIGLTFAVSCMATAYPNSHWGPLLYFDSLLMFVFILLSGRWLEAHLRVKTAGALDAITTQAPQRANRLAADGSVQNIPLSQLQVGDSVRVLAGEALPADGVVLHGQSWVDEALLTGESKPIEKQTGSAVVAGSMNQSQALTVQVQRVGADTRYAQIVALMEAAAEHKPRLVQFADRMAQPFLLFILLLAAGTWAWWAAQGVPTRGMVTAINILVITCPCALALAAPAALLSSTAALAKSGILLRHIGALERLETVRQVLFDKTGTLSEDRIQVQQMHALGDWDATQIWAAAAGMAAQSLHPASRAIVQALPANISAQNGLSVRELAGMGLEAELPQGQSLRLGRATWCGAAPELAAQYAGGMQVWLTLHSAAGPVQTLAVFALAESLRPSAQPSVHTLAQQGYGLHMLTGDGPAAAQAVATALGLQARQWQAAMQPEDKLQKLHDLQAAHGPALMVGDGINDGPVLAGAQVSMAMAGAAPLAQVQADVLLLQDDLQAVPTVLHTARRTLGIVRQNLWWAVLYNAIAIPIAMTGLITPWIAGLGMAISSLVVLGNSARLQKLAPIPQQGKKSR